MNFTNQLKNAVETNNSLLCVGLDADLSKIPSHIAALPDPLFQFNKAIVDATHDIVCAYKPNSAFYEAEGPEGIRQLKQTADYIHATYPGIPVILDAKRGDIGNTNDKYVSFIYDYLNVDAVTLHPYLGGESLEPFLARADKGAIIMCRNSNPGAEELQDLDVAGRPLYEFMAERIATHWNANGNCLLVVGATVPNEAKRIREIAGDNMWFLVPGVGSQGGDVEATVRASVNSHGDGIVINSARGIIYAGNGEDFAEAARSEAVKTRDEINKFRKG